MFEVMGVGWYIYKMLLRTMHSIFTSVGFCELPYRLQIINFSLL